MHKQTLRQVFESKKYVAIAVSIFAGLFVLLLIISGFVFFEPHLLLYVPSDRSLDFSLIVAVAALSGFVIPMSIFRLKMTKIGVRKTSSGFIGSIIGAGAGACSCSSVGFAIVSTFGTVGATATAFLTNYEIPLRILSIGIIVITYFVTAKGLQQECKIQKDNTTNL